MKFSAATAQDSAVGSGSPAAAHLQRVIDPLRLRLLLEVDRLGSITRAADACSLAQPTASMHLRTLESAVGHRLIERTGRGTTLTDAGRLLVDHAHLVLSALDSLAEDLAALDGALSGRLRIASCDGFGNHVLPALVAAFAASRPAAELHVRVLRSGDVVRAVARGDVQVGIAGRTGHVAGVVTEPLLRDEVVWIAPARAAHDGHDGHDLPIARLRESVLMVPGEASSIRALTEQVLTDLGARPARILELDSVDAIKRAIRSGIGIGAVSRLAVAEELARGELHEITLGGTGPVARWIDLVHAEHRKPTPLARAFAHTLGDHCTRFRRGATARPLT